MGPSRANKRVRKDDIVENFWTDEEDSGSYLTVKLLSGKPLKEKGWPWVQQCIRGILGNKEKVDKANFLNNGQLLVKTKDSTQTEKLLKTHMFGDEECMIEKDGKLNQSRGTINATDLMDLSEDEIVGWLADFGVASARRFTRKVGNHTEKTPIILLTFNRPKCPTKLEFDYVVYQVRQHIPNPLICLHCGKFGHMQARCHSDAMCFTCGEKKHDDTCTQKCIHCGDTGHDCLSRRCPKWKKEKSICEIKVTRDVSYAYARRLYEQENQTPTLRPYATVVRGNSEAPPDPSLKAKVSTIEQKLDKMITLLDRLLQLHTTGDRGGNREQEENTSVQGTLETGQQVAALERTNTPQVQPTTADSDGGEDNMDMTESQPEMEATQEALPLRPTITSITAQNPLTEKQSADRNSPPQQSIRQSRSKQRSQDSAAPVTSKEQCREPQTRAQSCANPNGGISPSPQIGGRRPGSNAGRGNRMPSLTRKPSAPTQQEG